MWRPRRSTTEAVRSAVLTSVYPRDTARRGISQLGRTVTENQSSSRIRIAAGAALSLVALAEYDRRTTAHNVNADAQLETEASSQKGPPRFVLGDALSELGLLGTNKKNVCLCEEERKRGLARHRTIANMESTMNHSKMESRYKINWTEVLGEGAFGMVYSAVDRLTGEKVALKKISKDCTSDASFQQEMNTLLHLMAVGGHCNICGLHEHYDEGKYYYLILDLISGGEMFDALVQQGAYSEADAARLVREVASALSFLHGIDVVHGDLKPENLMLSTPNSSDAVIKVVDFGCAEVHNQDSLFSDMDDKKNNTRVGKTPAYAPPESFEPGAADKPLQPTYDMWGMGIILYIMLTGSHPFDLQGGASDKEIERKVRNRESPPLRNSKFTEHLSESAIDLIEQLMAWDAKDRMTAIDMLNHPWVRGETARTKKIEGSDEKLSKYAKYKSQLESKIFADLINWSDEAKGGKKESLLERAFRSLGKGKGFVTDKDLADTLGGHQTDPKPEVEKPNLSALSQLFAKLSPSSASEESQQTLSLSGFSDLVSENMKNKFFPKGHIVYKEGEKGDHMYFINSGTIEVSCSDGSVVQRSHGNFFGEGALLHPEATRSASIKCVTPVHTIEISREYFEKYLAGSESALMFNLKEKDKTRKRNRAKAILRLQKKLRPMEYKKGQYLYKSGQWGKALYILEEGKVNVTVENNLVFSMKPGDICGEHSLLTGRRRNTSAMCHSDICKVNEFRVKDFKELLKKSPKLKQPLLDINLRREFQKAMVMKLKSDFPNESDLKAAFDAADEEGTGHLSVDNVRNILSLLDKSVSEKEINDVISSLNLSKSGLVTFEEFKEIFGVNEQKAKSL
eukprot:CAMPEP_0198291050 /NCGR_PEP_ID=MMETSP1449-20131203/8707_1 /TAXON_ID=420275 /ORGANISM="Attheya septentrionalis, Strain CCMP2084" /LENGTH=853 /DNA_ID=CAMNT_0043989641 /DNA_START=254 /DNA_END=2815 /DNA_ORIENTATION=+